MSICLDSFFDREHTDKYKCFEFAAEVWAALTGESLIDRVGSYTHGQVVSLGDAHSFTVLPAPISPCLVLMRDNPAFADKLHMGVFYEGKIIQLMFEGVSYRNVTEATYGFRRVRFVR